MRLNLENLEFARKLHRHIRLAGMFAAACKRAVANGKPSAAQIFASAAATQRRLALELMGVRP